MLFTGRLVRHLGAQATLLTVLDDALESSEKQERVHRFLDDGIKTLDVLGVPAKKVVRSGRKRETIFDEMKKGAHDLLVLGAPLPDINGKIVLDGLAGHFVRSLNHCPMLIVRSSNQTSTL